MNNVASLEIPNREPCAFCDYLSGVRPYTILARSDRVAIMVTREQRGLGHVLVLPVRHYPTLLQLVGPDAYAVMDAVRESARCIAEALGPSGIAVWQNNGKSAMQTIPHIHFHVAGTLASGGTERGPVPELSLEETETIARALRPNLTWP